MFPDSARYGAIQAIFHKLEQAIKSAMNWSKSRLCAIKQVVLVNLFS
jgi:hypothetical protein